MKVSPIEALLAEALRDFDKHLREMALVNANVKNRLLGARQFVEFLIGRPPKKHGRSTLSAEDE